MKKKNPKKLGIFDQAYEIQDSVGGKIGLCKT